MNDRLRRTIAPVHAPGEKYADTITDWTRERAATNKEFESSSAKVATSQERRIRRSI